MTESVYDLVKLLVKLLTTSPDAMGVAGCSVVVAYENDIKPYPVEKPILAFSVDKVDIGAPIVQIAEDGEQTVTRDRPVDGIVRLSIFVPYAEGPERCQALFKTFADNLLFHISIQNATVSGLRAYACDYVRDCGALVLDADFTLSYTLTSSDEA